MYELKSFGNESNLFQRALVLWASEGLFAALCGGDYMRPVFIKRRTEILDYMQSMLGQLRTMAEAERCDMLAYLIEMAYVEASDIIRGERPARIQQARRRDVA